MAMDKVKLIKRKLKNGNTSLILEYQQDGKRKFESTGFYLIPEVTEFDRAKNQNAVMEAIALKSQRTLGIEREVVLEEEEDMSPFTLKEYMAEYLKSKKANEGLSDSHKRHLTCFIKLVNGYLKKRHKANMPLAAIDVRFARDFIKYIQQEYTNDKSPDNPKHLSQSTQRLNQQYMVAMLNLAVRKGLIKQNPFLTLEKRERIPKAITQRDYLTVDEVKAIMNTETQAPETKKAFLFACFTGLRYGDVAALTWGHVKSGTGGQYIALIMGKTKRMVNVPLSKTALSLMPEREDGNKDTLVFNVASLCNADRALKRMATKAGIQKDVTFHTSRHTFATLSLSAGVDLAVVSSILGHNSIKTTQIYAEVLMQAKIAAINRVKSIM